MIQSLWKIFRQILEMLNVYLPYDPAIPLLSTHPSEMKSIYLHRDLHLYHLLYSKRNKYIALQNKKGNRILHKNVHSSIILIVPNERHYKCPSTDYD